MSVYKLCIAFLITMALLSSCNPKVSTKISKSYQPVDFKQEIIVLGISQEIPVNSEELGSVKIGDSGFTVNCNYETVIQKAKDEARISGGNVIKIIEHSPPSMVSSCHRIIAKILRVENPEDLKDNEEENEIISDIDYAIIYVYRYNGTGALVNYDLHLGDSVICRIKNNYKTTLHIKKNGYNTLWAKTESKAEIPINIQPGKEYYVKCGIQMGVFVGQPTIKLIDKKTGKAEFESFNAKNQ